jgi:hypothetical protein
MIFLDSADARPRRSVTGRKASAKLRTRREARGRWLSASRAVPRCGSTSVNSSLLAALATIAAAILAASAVGGAGFYDSGWSVAKPSTVLDDHPTNDPEMRIAINQVLEQSQVPLLRTPAPNVSSLPAIPHPALRTLEADGWKPSPIKFSHSPDTVAPPVATLGEPLPIATEAECGGPESGDDATHDRGEYRARHEAASNEETPDAYAPSATSDAIVEPADESPAATNDESAASSANESTAEVTDQSPSGTRAAEEHSSAAADAAKSGSSPQTFTVRRIPLSDEVQPAKKRPDESPLVEPLKGPLPPMTKNMQNLRNKVRTVLKMYYNKPENSHDNDPWEMMHGMLAYGLRSQIREGGPKGDLITAVGWLCYNKPSKGLTLMYVTPEGELRAKQGAGLQGHMGQLLAMLAQCRVSPDYPIKVGTHDFTIRDLIEVEKKTCYEKTELTFKLIGLMHYLDSDAKWVNDQGLEWDIPKLISEELAQPIRGAACGGTHRLSGLSLAARTRVRRGEPLDGEFAQASVFVEKYHNYAFQLQNSDGSLSTEWFRGKGDDDDNDRRVKTTGHILEWLCYSLSDDQIRSNRVFSATNYLATLLYTNYDHEWEKGPIGHAIHALRLYDERVLQPYDNEENIASQKPARTSQSGMKSRSQKR